MELTSEEPWNPYSEEFESKEMEARDRYINATNMVRSNGYHIEDDPMLRSISQVFSDRHVIKGTSTPSPNISVVQTKHGEHKSVITPSLLSEYWGIGIQQAEHTLKVTTQKFIRSSINPLEKRYRTAHQQLRYRQLGGEHGRFYSDTMFSTRKSINNNACGQFFINNIGFSYFVPMQRESEAPDALVEFIQHVGIPSAIHTDGSKVQTRGEWLKVVKKYHIKTTETEPHSPWQNRAEAGIRELKRHTSRLMRSSNSPKTLWDFCCTLVSKLRTMMPNHHYTAHGRTPHEIVTGETPDISEYVAFKWYQAVWYLDSDSYPEERKKIGRWLGVSHRVGQAMCFWILTANASVISRSSVQAISPDELKSENIQNRIQDYDKIINDRIGDHIIPTLPIQPIQKTLYIMDEDENDESVEHLENDAVQDEEDNIAESTYDQLLTAEVYLPQGDKMKHGKVTGYKRDNNGLLIGKSNPNPLLNSRMYRVEFTDGTVQDYAANIIAEAIYSEVDDEGNKHLLFKEIITHRKTPKAIGIDQMWVEHPGGNKHMKRTTIGWEFCVMWKDGTTTWETLANLKASFPIQVAEYALAQSIDKEPAFAWWIPTYMQKRERIIKSLKSRFQKRTHKFGIEIPRSVEGALRIDRETNTTFWSDAIAKEMKNNWIAFKILTNQEKVPIGYKFIRCHMNFEVKMDFTRKARFVAGGHMTDPPTSLTYSSVVSRDSVRLGFLLAALNDVDLISVDIGNAYLQATTKEKVYTIAGPEFGEFQGHNMLIVRALYGLKSSGAAWHEHFSNNLYDMNFKPSYADPDVWMRPAVKPNGFQYYEYILVYVDDLLILSHQATAIVKEVQKLYRLKDDEIGPPKTYLGAQVKQSHLPHDNSKKQWAVSAEQYIKNAVTNIERKLDQDGMKLNSKKYSSTPLTMGYRPELDVSPLLSDDAANFYQHLIGVLRWTVELGRIDILIHVMLLSSYLMQPREGHLSEAL